jgi:hypothetical protein
MTYRVTEKEAIERGYIPDPRAKAEADRLVVQQALDYVNQQHKPRASRKWVPLVVALGVGVYIGFVLCTLLHGRV